MSETFTQRAQRCGKNCPEKQYRKCLLSTYTKDKPDFIVGYDRMHVNECIINYRLKYYLVWELYLDYQNYKNYAELPFLLAILLQTMNNDKYVLNEYLRKEREDK